MARTADVTLYETLGVEPTASQDEIRGAYRKLLRTAHPDSGGTVGMFRSVQHAYDVLSTPGRRAEYDAEGNTTDGRRSNGPDSTSPKAGSHNAGPDSHEDASKPQPMEDIPTPPDPGFPDPVFIPPERPPERKKSVARWTKIWAGVLGGIGILLVLFQMVGMLATISFRESVGGDPGPTIGEFMPRIVGTAIFFIIAAILPYAILKIAANRTPQIPLATDFIQPRHLRTKEFGVPGEGLTAARFGDRAELGKTGEERTARLLREIALAICPAARVIHGLHWPGKDHADIDHALIVGDSVMLIDSKFMKDGEYWFDNIDLYRDGTQLDAFKLGYAVADMRSRFPGLEIAGVVLMHSPKGKLDRPIVELANVPVRRLNDPSYAPVPMMNPRSFSQYLHRHVLHTNTNAVNARLLSDLLQLRQV